MRKIAACFLVFIGAGLLAGVNAYARDQIQIAGSSTVLPYAKIVAEAFGDMYPDYKIPVIESGGTGAGIKEFCRGVGVNTIDIVNASRRMEQSELASCKAAGVGEVQEVRFGYDGIVLATDISGQGWNLTPGDIYKALAAQVMVDGRLQKNRVKTWADVNAALPKWEVRAYLPGEKHGTREVVENELMLAGCKTSGAFEALKKSGLAEAAAKAACIAVRKDGRVVDIDGDYSETLARVIANKTGIGVFGLSFYENNADKLEVVRINGVVPTAQTIVSGEYAVSRPLYFYVKKAHLGVIPGLQEYVEFFLSDSMTGPDSPLVDYGLIAAPEHEREAQRKKFSVGETLH
ncbi:MAG: Phosphate binding protein [Candidatus Tokpelaia hoelldobleri]|uniref:Phosphate binding protein n=1 Tax=Candidatus Tokpelaia hoelldobleri TaxID=1902579 RepID=A0A1U9JWJ7_9HYPH|nr:MAG: Phosphate binding protein [Candidatus Tokpelaia hoelldoblerii]